MLPIIAMVLFSNSLWTPYFERSEHFEKLPTLSYKYDFEIIFLFVDLLLTMLPVYQTVGQTYQLAGPSTLALTSSCGVIDSNLVFSTTAEASSCNISSG